MNWFVYILYSKQLNRYYTGCTGSLESRMEKHADTFYGRKSFTARADDWELVFEIACSSEMQAKKIEQHIKQMKSRVYIDNLLRYPEMSQNLREKYSDC